MPWVEVNGQDIYYTESGSGQPLVFLHGNSSCSEAWYQQIAHFGDRFHVYAYDSVNHGHSSNSPRDAEEPDRADELEGFLAAMGIERPILIGNSMGGNTLLRWAARHPDRATALVASSIGIRSGEASTPPPADPLPEATLYVPVGASFTPAFKDEQPLMLERYYRVRSTATRLEALRHPRRPSAKTVAERAAMEERVGSIRSPLLILTAEFDFALEPARRLRALMPQAEYQEIGGAPHNAYFEMPDTWNAIVDTYLSRVLAATGAPLTA
jgi:pimeloyl-ACP methyl ester carboxylesterase